MADYHKKNQLSIINDSFRLMYDIFEYCKMIYIFDNVIKKWSSL